MVSEENKQFIEKHGTDAQPDSKIENLISNRGKNSELPCAVAFEIAKELGVSAGEIGKNADLLNFRLIKCQLGLFGYDQKKIVKPKNNASRDLQDAILQALVDGRLPCEKAWGIASRFKVPKMTVSGACEAMVIKIKPCQLGAF